MMTSSLGYSIPPPLSSRPPATVGQKLHDIDSPALVVRNKALEHNLAKVHQLVKDGGSKVVVRPHGKAHKSVLLAAKQVESGCVGVCAAKLGEAASFLEGGIKDVLLTNQLVGQPKADRLAELAAKHPEAKLAVCVDSFEGVDELSAAARSKGVHLNVLVEVNVGQDRGGVECDKAVPLVRHVASKAPHLVFGGVQGYMGLNQHIRARSDRAAASRVVADKLRGVVGAIEGEG
eukprot:CAMPEP_0169461856 /NCGR_PEP_ID=MMETSP1042-20121227/19253_1 /TAXON_ID=464988 /ORGANISM="Hemiselmis andersenii, Strain CCMP1180" /LENGTH=232 /DNA_ID=CAMNT_0009574461 /DNA_START=55 /DNA_END=749 /DNA_ORIENTATION=+